MDEHADPIHGIFAKINERGYNCPRQQKSYTAILTSPALGRINACGRPVWELLK